MVFKGRTALIEGVDYMYVGGVVALESGAFVGEIITIIIL